MVEWASISIVKLGLDTLRGIWRWMRRNKRNLTPVQRLEKRNKWKPKFEEFLLISSKECLSTDIIIRDIRRLDDYPELKIGKSRKKGISPWFRTSFVKTYERGFMVSIAIGGLVELRENQWRFRDWINNEDGEKFWYIGFIPYENVESVDWEGDPYYNCPHIFCYFDQGHREPYERKSFCRKWGNFGITHFTEVTDMRTVIKNSKKFGLKYFG